MAEEEVTEVTKEQYTEFNTLMTKVYGWVFIGVLITSMVPFIVEHHFKNLIEAVNHKPEYILVIVVFEFTVVWLLKAFVNRFPPVLFYISFVFYSLLNGTVLTLAFNLFSYTGIFVEFWIIAIMFGPAILLGDLIKFDMSGIGGFLIIALPGLILAAAASIYFKSSLAGYIINFGGVMIFIYLALSHRLKIMKWVKGEETLTLDGSKPSILGALMLYLDFTLLFIFIERFLD